MYIENIMWILETYELDRKHILHNGNITFVWKHTHILVAYNETSLIGIVRKIYHVGLKYTIILRKVYDHSTENIRSAPV